MAKRKAERKAGATDNQDGMDVPTYPLREGCAEKTHLDPTTWQIVSFTFAPIVHTLTGFGSMIGYKWYPDEAGTERLRTLAERHLVELRHKKRDVIERMPFMVLFNELRQALTVDRDKAVEKMQRDLRPYYDEAVKHREHFHQRIRETIALVDTYLAAADKGESVARVPVPYYDEKTDDHLLSWRSPDSKDTGWIFFVVALKLEGLFGHAVPIIPDDLRNRMSGLSPSRQFVDRWIVLKANDLDVEGLRTYWTPIEAELTLRSSIKSFVSECGPLSAEFRKNWRDRYVRVTADESILRHWQGKGKNLLNRLQKANDDKGESLTGVWPFGEKCERAYEAGRDLDAIYLAVGLRLEWFFRARQLVTEEMESSIVGEWQFAVPEYLRYSELDVLMHFGPHFNGDPMTDDVLEILWGYIEQDLREHGLLDGEPGRLAGKPTAPATAHRGRKPKYTDRELKQASKIHDAQVEGRVDDKAAWHKVHEVLDQFPSGEAARKAVSKWKRGQN